jgi:hypothetical protein
LASTWPTPPWSESFAAHGKTLFVISQACDTKQERDEAKAGTELHVEWCADYLATI